MTGLSTPAKRSFHGVGALLLIYLAVTLLTQARFMADTIDYASSVFTFDSRGWDFGHLWWLPLGWLLSGGGSLVLPGAEGDTRTTVILLFLAINWLSGLASVLLMRALLVRLGFAEGLALLVTVAFLFAQGFLNFAQTGGSYIPGLAFVLLALYLAAGGPRATDLVPAVQTAGINPAARSVGAGLALGAAICFWFPYVLVVPGVILAPLILSGWSRPPFWFAVGIGVGLGVLLGLGYGVALVSLGITDVTAFRAWMAKSSHGVITGGVARMVFGLARSFIFMGEDGVLFKRFLLKDPFNPVSLFDLVRLSLWKFLFFYAAMLALLLNLLRSADNRRLLALLLVGGLPVVVFGIFWQGGDMERYLALYPFLFLALAGVLSAPESWRAVNAVVASFFVLVVVVNGLGLSRWQVGRYHRGMSERVEELRPRLTPNSRVIIVKDSLKLLPRDFPLDAASRGLPILEGVTPGLVDAPRWRESFREVVLTTWKNGGDVWISKRLQAAAPPASSAWVEGDDPRLKWSDVQAYFANLDVNDPVGEEDGFVRVVDSARTRRALAASSR